MRVCLSFESYRYTIGDVKYVRPILIGLTRTNDMGVPEERSLQAHDR